MSTARTWVALPLRAAATAVVVVAISVTLIAVGSPTPVAQKPNAATLVRGATEAAQLGAGQTIYIVNAHNNPNVVAELAAFNQKFGLPTCTTRAIATTAPQAKRRVDPSDDVQRLA